MDMAAPLTLLFVDKCPYCDEVKPQVKAILEGTGIELDIRKPKIQEHKELNLPGFPSLVIDGEDGNLVLNGSKLGKVLSALVPFIKADILAGKKPNMKRLLVDARFRLKEVEEAVSSE